RTSSTHPRRRWRTPAPPRAVAAPSTGGAGPPARARVQRGRRRPPAPRRHGARPPGRSAPEGGLEAREEPVLGRGDLLATHDRVLAEQVLGLLVEGGRDVDG